MGRIVKLNRCVYNRISAGEVVENPSSVVKELVENSIDAGAHNIVVMIEEGGIKSINVIDDGDGIAADDLELTVYPHATSKIATINDLSLISTLGFRGEALASIAAIAQLEIKSKYVESDVANKIVVKGGEIEGVMPVSLDKGTSVSVTNLFYNTPARFKFLRSKKSEESDVTSLMKDLILSNPDVAIKYYVDNKVIYGTAGEGLDTAVTAVYPPKITENLLKLDANENYHSVRGFIAKPNTDAIKSNRTFQTIIINGRVIDDPQISAVVQNAYAEALMKHCFPTYVIDMTIPFEDVDINVHPNKRTVKFANHRFVYGLIYRAVKEALRAYYIMQNKEMMGLTHAQEEAKTKAEERRKAEEEKERIRTEKAKKAREINFWRLDPIVGEKDFIHNVPDDVIEQLRPYAPDKEKYGDKKDEGIVLLIDGDPESEDYIERKTKAGYSLDNYIHFAMGVKNIPLNELFEKRIGEDETGKTQFVNVSEGVVSPYTVDMRSKKEKEEQANREKPEPLDYKILGQLFDTYILIQCYDNLFVIDQHAAHERLLYDALMTNVKSSEAQPMFCPFFMECKDINFFLKNSKDFASLGFDIRQANENTIAVMSIPSTILDMNIDAFFAECEENMGNLQDNKTLKSKLASMACHHAIKGGTHLDEEQTKKLMTYFFELGVPLQCPHGRPVILKITKTEIEKMFRRIV